MKGRREGGMGWCNIRGYFRRLEDQCFGFFHFAKVTPGREDSKRRRGDGGGS